MRARVALGLVTAAALCWVGLLRHRPRKVPMLSGYRCDRCKRAFADLDDAGETGNGYVKTLRTLFDRDNRQITRTSHWLN